MKGQTRLNRSGLMAAVLAGVLVLASSLAHAATTEMMNSGYYWDYSNFGISADGRFIAFSSSSSTIVPDDTNNTWDVFVYDSQTGTTERVSVDSEGNQANQPSSSPLISADGRYVFFYSGAGLTPDCPYIYNSKTFMYDRLTRQTECLGKFRATGISPDGTYVVGRIRDGSPIFPHPQIDFVQALNRLTGDTWLVSSDSEGNKANAASYGGSISSDGRYVAFVSSGSNLVPGDDGLSDVFVKDLLTGAVEIISEGAKDLVHNYFRARSYGMSADGRYVVYSVDSRVHLTKKNTYLKSSVLIYDRQTKATEQIPFVTRYDHREYGPEAPAISGDGRYVAFRGTDRTIPYSPTIETLAWDIFRFDRQTGDIIRVSVDNNGEPLYGSSGSSIITPDGRFVAFWTDLLDPDLGGSWSRALFVRDNFDQDNDTFGDEEDCNDFDAAIFPGAPEVCKDHVDNDCDGLADKDDPDCPWGVETNSSFHNKK